MAEQSCQCCGDRAQNATDESTADRWTPGGPVLDADLPESVQTAFGRFLGRESVETLSELADEINQHAEQDTISVDELCVSDGQTAHYGVVDGERYDFLCFYDAVILAALRDDPVEIHTESPEGASIEMRAVGTERLAVTPADAVFSFGIAADVDPPSDGKPNLERGYAAICPYVKAFPDRAAYERWAQSVPAATVALELADATDLAAALVN
ncbi:organomercurial lyase [Halovenus marina]|uniref:organomercurial lyase n=1 Tax=Halovenus marina TaxID=3396621 RepID=UPI003F54D9FF